MPRFKGVDTYSERTDSSPEQNRRERQAAREGVTDVEQVEAELERIGATDSYEGTGGITAEEGEEPGTVVIRDEAVSVTLPVSDALQRLKAVPDDAGWEAAWDALPDAT